MRLSRLALITGAAVVLTPAPVVRAHPYEVEITIDDEQDLYELRDSEQISDETLETLLELYQDPIDLNRASREELYTLPDLSYAEVDAILAYRDETGWIYDARDLATAGVVSADRLDRLRPFILVRARDASPWAVDGWARAQTLRALDDEGAPPIALQARAVTLQDLTVGFAAVLTRTRLGDIRYDPVRDGLSAEGPATRFELPKIYARWDRPRWAVIAGSYRVGFGQRLTFDNTRRREPDGIETDHYVVRSATLVAACRARSIEGGDDVCDGLDGNISPDFGWIEGLFGVAATAKRVALGPVALNATAFASYQRRDLYQYEIYDAGRCSDPTNDDDPACRAPIVYHRTDDPLGPTSAYQFSSLPYLFAERTVGGNVGLTNGRRERVGVTAYASSIGFLTEGVDLDFQEWSRFPRGGPFGAVGADGAVGLGQVDVFAEVTRSFDGVPGGGGGFGGIARAVTTPGKHDEIELSLRAYGRDFLNPNGRPIAAPDEVFGQRARDEQGARLRYSGRPADDWSVRATADVWRTPSRDTWNVTSYLRGDVDLTDQYRAGLSVSFDDKDVGEGARGACFELAGEEDELGVVPCSGQRARVAARFRYQPTRRYRLSAQYQHTWVDDTGIGARFRQDSSAWLQGSAELGRDLRLRARSAYYDDDLLLGGKRLVSSYVEAGYRVRSRDWFRLRYQNFWTIGAPSPGATLDDEHWLSLEYETRY